MRGRPDHGRPTEPPRSTVHTRDTSCAVPDRFPRDGPTGPPNAPAAQPVPARTDGVLSPAWKAAERISRPRGILRRIPRTRSRSANLPRPRTGTNSAARGPGAPHTRPDPASRHRREPRDRCCPEPAGQHRDHPVRGSVPKSRPRLRNRFRGEHARVNRMPRGPSTASSRHSARSHSQFWNSSAVRGLDNATPAHKFTRAFPWISPHPDDATSRTGTARCRDHRGAPIRRVCSSRSPT